MAFQREPTQSAKVSFKRIGSPGRCNGIRRFWVRMAWIVLMDDKIYCTIIFGDKSTHKHVRI